MPVSVTTSRTRLAILSDTRLFREGIQSLLSDDPSVTVVDGASEPGPEVVLLDGRMDGALALCAAFSRRAGGPRVLVVAAKKDEEWTGRALRAGARGVLPLGSGSEFLVKAIRVVDWGQIWAPRSAAAEVVPRSTADGALSEQSLIERGLSARERAVCRLAACGLSNKEIADRLFICPATVKAHLTRVFQKLGLGSRSQLAALYGGMTPVAPLPGDAPRARPQLAPGSYDQGPILQHQK